MYQIKISGLYVYGLYKSYKFNATAHHNPEINYFSNASFNVQAPSAINCIVNCIAILGQ